MTGFDRKDLAGDVATQNAQDLQRKNQTLRDQADSAIKDAQQKFDQSKSASEAFAPSDPLGDEARKRALADLENLRQVKNNAMDVGTATGASDKAAQAAIDNAALQKEETSLRRAAYQAIIAGKVSAEGGGPAPTPATGTGSVADIQSKIDAAKDADLHNLTLGAHTDTSGLEAQLATAQQKQDDAQRAYLDDAKKRQKSADALKAGIQSNKDTSYP